MRRFAFVLGLLALVAPQAYADLFINEVLGSTVGTDAEFIELYNSGPAPVAIGGWQIELWDSDVGSSYGGSDGGAPYTITAGAVLNPGDYYVLANDTFNTYYDSSVKDQSIQENGIENSSYTIILTSSPGGPIVDSAFVTDGGAGDSANRAGAPILPSLTVGPDGTFLPAGFYRFGDGGPTANLLEFQPQPSASATPGGPNIPEPASLGLLALGLLIRRR